jgi:hypothetical protein
MKCERLSKVLVNYEGDGIITLSFGTTSAMMLARGAIMRELLTNALPNDIITTRYLTIVSDAEHYGLRL